jgi:Mg-chelatase subunit ChlD
MRRRDSEDALLLTDTYGGTPSATAIKAASDYLHTHYPDATKIIIHLTDGCPSSGVEDPYHNQEMFDDNTRSVRNLINNLPIPVFTVGCGHGTSAETMREQYNHDK